MTFRKMLDCGLVLAAGIVFAAAANAQVTTYRQVILASNLSGIADSTNSRQGGAWRFAPVHDWQSIAIHDHEGVESPTYRQAVLRARRGHNEVVVRASSHFGIFSNDILIGNSTDGTIAAFDPNTKRFCGFLEDTDGQPIVIPSLRGLLFGTEGSGDADTLYFVAGSESGRPRFFGAVSIDWM